ncbi:MAG: ABC transporter ATP-binding protein [Candidatus Bathyarchaeota archaeon]|nr:ABC transporter ATP-binding protein [Candidatus Bathyarchaeota archaeon]
MGQVYSLTGISKTFGDVHALKNINLEVTEGETLGVIGRSGSGKTTLLRILAGLETPTDGSLYYKGSILQTGDQFTLRQDTTMTFQMPLFLRGTVFTNLAYGLRVRKQSESEIKGLVGDALERVRLGGFKYRDARSLSGGEQQRVSLARALLLDPEVLLLDEPTSNLDPANISVITRVIEEESKLRTIVVSTHDYSQIRKLTKRTIHLEEGIITEEGPPRELVSITRVTENLFSGDATIEKGVCQMDTGTLVIRATASEEGPMTIHVRPEDIILSKDWVETSARNQFRGPIVEVVDEETIVKLKINVGEVFTAQVTKRSFTEMGLNVGTEVNISFKASAVIVI